ncbi:MAG: 5-formyltetrahydrofolate cyclo-ligase [Thioalkalispiraceae bacterium]|jgi:5-formyltetrahydrofolate cyclo-ligase
MDKRQQIRSELKQRRAKYSDSQCQSLSWQICNHLQNQRAFTNGQRFAFYYPMGNEVDLRELMERSWSLEKKVFLPVLAGFPKGCLWWVEHTPATPMYLNQYGIPEPEHPRRARRTKLRSLDIIFMPLVAFDTVGNRMGMGGGFYDRSLAKVYRADNTWHRPLRLGVAYSWQQVDAIPAEKWDIPLDAIATENGVTWFRR